MFKFTAIFATLCLISAASAGLVATTHHVVHEPTLAKVGHVVHSSPSAVSHQSITQVHGKTSIVHPVLAPVVKTTIHAAPLVVKTVQPVHTYHAAPVVHSVPLVHSSPVVSVHHHHH
ncbi:retinin-like [Calliphora vicina]|uniref:retinin-like n=1 Tax=Calliphora vicina TaxID=7373 RepID=UPI00325ADD72